MRGQGGLVALLATASWTAGCMAAGYKPAPDEAQSPEKLATRGEAFDIGPGLVIGRALACEVTIDDSYASGRHARLYDRDGHVYIEDLNSTNGTYVNGARVHAQQELRQGDVIRIGDAELRFESG